MQMASIAFSYNFTIPSELLPYSILGGQKFPSVLHAPIDPQKKMHTKYFAYSAGAFLAVFPETSQIYWTCVISKYTVMKQ